MLTIKNPMHEHGIVLRAVKYRIVQKGVFESDGSTSPSVSVSTSSCSAGSPGSGVERQ
jgi:hypothetical protein